MNLRDLPVRLIKKLARDGDQAFEEWWHTTDGGKMFGTNAPVSPKKIFEYAFSKGTSAVLHRIDEVKEVDTSNTRKGL